MWWGIGGVIVFFGIVLAVYSIIKLRKEDTYDDALG
jgi:hypothetical protein